MNRTGTRSGATGGDRRGATDGSPAGRNVVLVCLDTVRKDVFDEFAPRLQRLADASVPQCRATSIWSAPSHAGMFTGLLPHQHGVHAGSPGFAGMDAGTFLDDLPRHATFGVSANPYASSPYGFDAYFDEFVDVDDYSRYPDALDVRECLETADGSGALAFLRDALGHDRPLRSLGNGALAAVARLSEPLPIPRLLDHGAAIVRRETVRRVERAEEPFFGFVNVMDAHTPLQHVRGFDRDLHDAPDDWICTTDRFDPWEVIDDIEGHREYLEHRRGLYAAAIDYLDRQIAGLVADVRAASDRETTFVVTADHGENLGYPADRRLVMHKGSMTEGLLHVPLCLVGPDVDAPVETERYVSHLDLGRIVTALAAGEPPLEGVFSERAHAEVVGLNALTASDGIEEFDHWDRMLRCAYDGRAKVVWDSLGNVDEYRVDFETPGVDRHVRADGSVPEWARSAFDVGIDRYKRRADSTTAGDVGDATRGRLEDLGYI